MQITMMDYKRFKSILFTPLIVPACSIAMSGCSATTIEDSDSGASMLSNLGMNNTEGNSAKQDIIAGFKEAARQEHPDLDINVLNVTYTDKGIRIKIQPPSYQKTGEVGTPEYSEDRNKTIEPIKSFNTPDGTYILNTQENYVTDGIGIGGNSAARTEETVFFYKLDNQQGVIPTVDGEQISYTIRPAKAISH